VVRHGEARAAVGHEGAARGKGISVADAIGRRAWARAGRRLFEEEQRLGGHSV
jgi:hypothetical protein